MKRNFLRAAVMACGFLAMVRGLQAAPLDDRIPADAVIYAGWAGADALAPKYAESNLKGVVENTKLGDYVNENWTKWTAKAGTDAKDMEEGAKAIKILWRHPGAIYVGPMGFQDVKKPTFKMAILVDAGDDAAVLMDMHKKAMEKNPASPDAKMQLTQDGSVLILTIGDVTPDTFMNKVDQDRSGGRLPSSPAYVAATKGMQKDPAIAVYVDAAKIIATIEEGLEKSPDAPPEAKKAIPEILKALGLTGLTQAALTAGFDHKEWTEQAFIGTTGPRVGLLALLDGPPISDAALAMVPKDAASLTAGRMDLMKVMALVRDVIGKIDPRALDQFEKFLAQANQENGIDLEKNILNALGDEWLTYRGPVTDEGEYPLAFVQKLRDADAFAKTLALLETQVNAAAQGKVKIEKLDAGKFPVTGIQLPVIMPGVPASIAWTLRGGVLYVTTAEAMENAIIQVEEKHDSITANPDYKTVRAALPEVKPTAISFSEPAKIYPSLQRTLNGTLPMARLAGIDLPSDLLPAPKKIAPFLTPGGSVMWSEADGFHFASRSAFPGAEIISGQISPTAMAGVMTVVTAGAIPAVGRTRTKAYRVQSAMNLRGVGMSCMMWSTEHDDSMPDDISQLVLADQVSPQQLVMRQSGTKPLEVTAAMKEKAKTDPASFAKEVAAHCDYVYLGKGMKTTAPAQVIVAYEKPGAWSNEGITLQFVDGHSEFSRWANLGDAFKATNDFRKEQKLEPVDVDALVKTGQGH